MDYLDMASDLPSPRDSFSKLLTTDARVQSLDDFRAFVGDKWIRGITEQFLLEYFRFSWE
jgi:hypothetical protein